MNYQKMEELLASEVNFSINDTLEKAWVLYKAQALLHIGYVLLNIVIQVVFYFFLEDFISVFSLIFSPPLTAGYYLVANRISRNEAVDFANYFDGFKYWFLAVVISLTTGIFTVLGFLALILPGIYLAVGYMFAVLFGIFGGLEFWTAMEFSRKLVTKNWWKFFAFGLVLILVNVLGFLFMGIGLLVTIPLSYMAVYVVFEGLTEEVFSNPTDETLHAITHE